MIDPMFDEYESLPEIIKAKFSYEDYKNMGNHGRYHLIEQETEPEYEEN